MEDKSIKKTKQERELDVKRAEVGLEKSRAIATQDTSIMKPIEHEQIKILAKEYYDSKAISQSFENINQVVMAIEAGASMGMTPLESLNGLYFVGGKLNIYGKATPAAIRRHGWNIVYHDETDFECSATIENIKTGEKITDTFKFSDAEKSGFTKDKNGNLKFGWRLGANRKRKMRYGVISQIISTYIPEVLGNVAGIAEYSQDYIEGEVIDRNEDKFESITDAIKLIEDTTNLVELKEVFINLPPKIKGEQSVFDAKEKRKEELNESN